LGEAETAILTMTKSQWQRMSSGSLAEGRSELVNAPRMQWQTRRVSGRLIAAEQAVMGSRAAIAMSAAE
jgi:hypothetical protein